MQKNKVTVQKKTSLSKSTTIQELADFWDSHDTTDFERQTHDVKMEFDIKSSRHYIAIDPDLMTQVSEEAGARGLSSQSLVNLWIKDKLVKH